MAAPDDKTNDAKSAGDANAGPFSGISQWLQGTDTLSTPDITRAQGAAIGQAAIAVLIVFGFDPGQDVRNVVLGLSGALAIALPTSDAFIRHGRAKYAENIVKARADQHRHKIQHKAAASAKQSQKTDQESRQAVHEDDPVQELRSLLGTDVSARWTEAEARTAEALVDRLAGNEQLIEHGREAVRSWWERHPSTSKHDETMEDVIPDTTDQQDNPSTSEN